MPARGRRRAGRRDLHAERRERLRGALVRRVSRVWPPDRLTAACAAGATASSAPRRDEGDESLHEDLLLRNMLRRLRGAARRRLARRAKLAQPRGRPRAYRRSMSVAALPTGVRPPTTLMAAVPADRSPSRAERRLADGLRRRDEAALGDLHALCGRTVMGFLVRALARSRDGGGRLPAGLPRGLAARAGLRPRPRVAAHLGDDDRPLARDRPAAQARARAARPGRLAGAARGRGRPEARRRRAGRALALRRACSGGCPRRRPTCCAGASTPARRRRRSPPPRASRSAR